MLEIERKRYVFKTKEIWFSDYPYDVDGYHSVIFRACKNEIEMNGFNHEDFNTLVIDLTQDIKTIWQAMSKSSCRYPINKAINQGVKIVIDREYESFRDLNRSFRLIKGIGKLDLDTELMRKYGTLIVAKMDDELLAGQFYLKDEYNIRWLVGASKRLEAGREKATLIGNANRLIIWEAIKFAIEHGLKEYDFGGYYTEKVRDEQKDRISFFKKSFGGKLITHYIYRKDYSRIYKQIKNIYQLTDGCFEWFKKEGNNYR